MNNPLKIVFVMLFAFLGISWSPAQLAAGHRQQFSVPTHPRSSWRGHIRIRNGLFGSVYKEHWGGGVTNNGRAVLTNLFDNAATVLPIVLGPGGIANNTSLVRTDGEAAGEFGDEGATRERELDRSYDQFLVDHDNRAATLRQSRALSGLLLNATKMKSSHTESAVRADVDAPDEPAIDEVSGITEAGDT